MKILLPILIMVFCIILISCDYSWEEPCSPRSYSCSIVLTDNDNNNLIGEDSEFHPDSVKIFVDSEEVETYFDNHKLTFRLDGLDRNNGKDYLVYLSYTEKDTLKLLIKATPGDCGYRYDIFSFIYNGEEFFPNSESTSDNPIYTIIR